MRERIDIVVPDQELARNAEKEERLRRARAFEPVDRVPVLINTNQWTLQAARGRTHGDYTRGPIENLREQILNRKWVIENIRDDGPIPTRALHAGPDLGCLRATEFEMEVVWPEHQPPKCRHPLTEPEQIDRLSVPDPAGGLNAKSIAWYHVMREAVADFDVRLNGEPLQVNVGIGVAGGPIPSAFALCGQNLLLWMALDPERTHRLMALVTDSLLRCHRYFDAMTGAGPRHGIGLGADPVEMIGLEMFREFVAPYYNRIYEAYPGWRGFHNCGHSAHLLDSLRDDLKITSHDGFGFCVDPAVLAAKMAGRVVLTGGPHPMLIKGGPRAAIVAEAERYIRVLGQRSGFILSLGGGTAPGTPAEHYHAMVEASQRVGNPAV